MSLQLLRFDWLDENELAHRSAIDKLDAPIDLGEQGVVLATADVQARLDAGAALTHDDGAASDNLTAERFYSQPLRI